VAIRLKINGFWAVIHHALIVLPSPVIIALGLLGLKNCE
jgi:hypothetical protein